MMRRSDASHRTGLESSRRSRLESSALGDASGILASAAREASVVSHDDVPPEASHDLLTDTQLAARWQLSRGTLANQRSQGRGPAYLKLAGRVRYRLWASRPTKRPDSCRGSQRERHPLVTRVTSGKRWKASFDHSVPDTQAFLAGGSQHPCQVALITPEVTAEVHAGSHAHIRMT
jgi:hypothetical protein